MTRDDIISMAREAGITTPVPADRRWHLGACCPLPALERFAALAAAAERKRFADECINLVAFHGGSVEIEAAICARGRQ